MRMAIAFALFAGATLLAPGAASAVPLALGDHAAVSRNLSNAALEPVARRPHKYSSDTPRNTRAVTTGPIIPIGGPISNRYWQFYYPYGGPLF